MRLQQLEEMLGGDEFCQLLATVARQAYKNRKVFLDELQTERSIEIRLRFEQLLKT